MKFKITHILAFFLSIYTFSSKSQEVALASEPCKIKEQIEDIKLLYEDDDKLYVWITARVKGSFESYDYIYKYNKMQGTLLGEIKLRDKVKKLRSFLSYDAVLGSVNFANGKFYIVYSDKLSRENMAILSEDGELISDEKVDHGIRYFFSANKEFIAQLDWEKDAIKGVSFYDGDYKKIRSVSFSNSTLPDNLVSSDVYYLSNDGQFYIECSVLDEAKNKSKTRELGTTYFAKSYLLHFDYESSKGNYVETANLDGSLTLLNDGELMLRYFTEGSVKIDYYSSESLELIRKKNVDLRKEIVKQKKKLRINATSIDYSKLAIIKTVFNDSGDMYLIAESGSVGSPVVYYYFLRIDKNGKMKVLQNLAKPIIMMPMNPPLGLIRYGTRPGMYVKENTLYVLYNDFPANIDAKNEDDIKKGKFKEQSAVLMKINDDGTYKVTPLYDENSEKRQLYWSVLNLPNIIKGIPSFYYYLKSDKLSYGFLPIK